MENDNFWNYYIQIRNLGLKAKLYITAVKSFISLKNQNPIPDPEVGRVLPDDGQGLFSLDLICNHNKLECLFLASLHSL